MEVKGVKSDNIMCRCCLASGAQYFELDANITRIENNEDAISFLDCLRYCTKLKDLPELPPYICTECGNILQIAYNFIKCALNANEVLCNKLCHREIQSQHYSPVAPQTIDLIKNDSTANDFPTTSKNVRYRCKVCSEKLETKKALKDHVKLHLDLILYCCQLCKYDCKKRIQLNHHYIISHNIQPTEWQLKPLTCSESKIEKAPIKMYKQHITGIKTKLDESHTINSADAMQQQQFEDDQLIEQQLREIEGSHLYEQGNKNNQTTFRCQDIKLATVINNANELSVLTEKLPQFNCDNLDNIAGKEMTVGNEFIIAADGTIREVMNNGVVIEYIDATHNRAVSNNNLHLNGIKISAKNAHLNNFSMEDNIMQVDDIIVEENTMTEINNDSVQLELSSPSKKPVKKKKLKKRLKCMQCFKTVQSDDDLKAHMLIHDDISQYFCDRCSFYTFVPDDLTQHYRLQHKITPTVKQLEPKNLKKNKSYNFGKRNEYACDLCLFETRSRNHLQQHYAVDHSIKASDVQLRPNLAENQDDEELLNEQYPNYMKTNKKSNKPDFPYGITCDKCECLFYWRHKLKEHYRKHRIEEMLAENEKANKQESTKVVILDNIVNKTQTKKNVLLHTVLSETNTETSQIPVDVIKKDTTTITTALIDTVLSSTESMALTPSHFPMEIDENSIMDDNIDIAALCTIPADAIQVVESDDIVIDNNIEFDLNGDTLFDDFEEEDGDNNNDYMMEQDSNLILTTDEDSDNGELDDDNQQAKNLQIPHCIYCNRTFNNQYQFENHMFIHRGLAPYRCDMCTNLYNTKRALIRHYKAVHKKFPTRDMIQAKGDKVDAAANPVEHLNFNENRATTLMCGKCPFESTDSQNIKIHLYTDHGIADDNFIIRKLPYECTRCIRSYAKLSSFVRHLKRGHLVETIIPQEQEPHYTAVSDTIETQTTTSISLLAPARCGQILRNHHNNDNGDGAGVGDEKAQANDNNAVEFDVVRPAFFPSPPTKIGELDFEYDLANSMPIYYMGDISNVQHPNNN